MYLEDKKIVWKGHLNKLLTHLNVRKTLLNVRIGHLNKLLTQLNERITLLNEQIGHLNALWMLITKLFNLRNKKGCIFKKKLKVIMLLIFLKKWIFELWMNNTLYWKIEYKFTMPIIYCCYSFFVLACWWTILIFMETNCWFYQE